MKGLQILDLDVDNDILGIATLFNPRSKIRVPNFCNLPDQKSLEGDSHSTRIGSSYVAEAVPHTIEVLGATKDKAIGLKLKNKVKTSVSNPLDQIYVEEKEKTSSKSGLLAYEITNPIVMFIK